MFKKAVKQQKKVAMAISGPSNSGKTFSALRVAKGFGPRVAVYDTEGNASSLYANDFDFDAMAAANRTPSEVEQAIMGAAEAGYDVVIIDSLTHAWEETKNIVDEKAKAMRTTNTFVAWKEGNKQWESLIRLLQSPPIHVICTMRAKTEFVQEKDQSGKTQVRKVGLAPQVRDGSEYEFDIMLSLNHDHYATVEKTRMRELDGKTFHLPDEQLGATIKAWSASGAEKEPPVESLDPRGAALVGKYKGMEDEPKLRAELAENRATGYDSYLRCIEAWEV